MHPVMIRRPPDEIVYVSDLFDSGWEVQSPHALGDQATFDFFNSGTSGRGLRLTLSRTAAVGDDGNDLPVNIAFGASVDLAWDDDAGLTGTLAASTTLAQLRTEILTLAEFGTGNVAYYGGETGVGGTPNLGYQGVFDGGTPDRYAWVEFAIPSANTALAVFGTSTPSNTDSAFLIPRTGAGRLMKPGDRIYTRRGASNDVPGSIEIWKLSYGEQRKYGG